MRIAFLGYGKMGKAVASLASERGHIIALTIDNEDEWRQHLTALQQCDVAVDFSTPSTAITNILRCFEAGVPLVSGTTGWHQRLPEMIDQCRKLNGGLFVASNFSIGMNIMFELNRRLAQLMNNHSEYKVGITETHHIHKLDAPSGTAISLAKDIAASIDRMDGWQLAYGKSLTAEESTLPGEPPMANKGEIPVVAIRDGEVCGIHQVTYDSPVDTITIRHSAKSRRGLAEGAILAAEFMAGRKGYYTMQDLLK